DEPYHKSSGDTTTHYMTHSQEFQVSLICVSGDESCNDSSGKPTIRYMRRHYCTTS
ncbi:hypothetical protein HAX54_013120, partial [Datura stramonium]|nr:hypothetical protein [Datura stramonium]